MDRDREARTLGNVPVEWGDAMLADRFRLSAVVQLELLHSTRNETEFQEWDERLSTLRPIPVTVDACHAAVGALRELASRSPGYHRVGLADALVAASAQQGGIGVLHYNHRHFAKLREVLQFDNQPLAEPGTFER